MVAISDGKKMRSKLDTLGRTGIFVGYPDDHAENVYRIINIQMKKIILSRNIQWLNSFWKEYKNRKDYLNRNRLMNFTHMMRMIRPMMKVKQKRPKKTR